VPEEALSKSELKELYQKFEKVWIANGLGGEEWERKLVFSGFLKSMVLRQRQRRRGRPSKGFDNLEGLAALYILNTRLGLSVAKIEHFINQVAMEWGLKYRIDVSTIKRRLAEVAGRMDKIQELLKKHEEKSKECPIVIDRRVVSEIMKVDSMVKLGKMDVMEGIKLAKKLAEKVSDYCLDGYCPVRSLVLRYFGLGGKNIGKSHFMTLMRGIEKLWEWMRVEKKKCDPRDWTPEDFYEFKRYMEVKKYAEGTIRKYFTVFWMLRPDLKKVMEGETAELKKKERGKRRSHEYVITPVEFKEKIMPWMNQLMEQARGKKREKLEELWLAFRLHLETMAREGWSSSEKGFEKGEPGSLFNAKVKQFNPEDCTIDIWEPKTQSWWRHIVVGKYFPSLCKELKKWIEKHGLKSDDKLFNITAERYRKFIKQIGKLLGKEDLHPHDIRRSGAFWAINYLNVPLEAITAESGGDHVSPFGVGWEDPKTLVDYYVSLAGRRLALFKRYAKLAAKLLENPEEVREKALEMEL